MALCLHHILQTTVQSEKGGLIVQFFFPLIYEDAIEHLPSSVFFFLYIPNDPEFNLELQSSVCVGTDEGSHQWYVKEMRRQR